jgi:hypothetical protein
MTGATLDRARLVKLCGMFGSDHAGERANAAAAADKLIREAGLRWPDVIPPALPPPPQRPNVGTVPAAVAFVLDHADALTPWERDFARSIQRLKYPPSPKQIEVLERLVDKARGAEARAA